MAATTIGPWSRRITDSEFSELRKKLLLEFPLAPDSPHGSDHWRRVEGFGLYLAEQTGADTEVVRLFSIFHDCQRFSDSHDPGHGPRAAMKAKHLRAQLKIGDQAFERLALACRDHTAVTHSSDITIATCWDADRLDLGRVCIVTDTERLNTEPARLLTRYDWLSRCRTVLGGVVPEG